MKLYQFLPWQLTFAIAAFAPTAAAQSPFTPERGWSIVRSDLEITIAPTTRKLSVEGVLELILDGKPSSIGPSVGINSRSPLMAWKRLTCAGAEVEMGKQHPTRASTRLAQIRFPKPKNRGDRIEIQFACELAKNGRQLAVGSKIALASWVEAWYPIPEPPKGASLGRATRAKGKTKFILPKGWSAVTNGALVSHEDHDDHTIEVWSTPRALSRSFAAAAYRRIVEKTDSITASLYLLSDSAKDPKAHVQALGQAIQAMTKRFGPYPFKNFSIAEVPGRIGQFGAASEQGFILVKPYFLAVEGGNLPLFAHEAGHAWWGNTVGTRGSGSLFCSESLAQYGAVLAIETIEGPAAATEFLRFSRSGFISSQCGRGYFKMVRREDDKPLAKLTSGNPMDHTLSDAKGHWVYHMLRRRVGDATFFATLRKLIERYDGRAMSLGDLREEFTAAAPTAGLKTFFSQWLDRTGAPIIEARCVRKADRTQLQIRQVQDGAPFILDLEVELRLRGGKTQRQQIRIGADRREVFELQLDKGTIVDSVAVDPDHKLLIWDPEYGPAPNAPVDDPVLTASNRAIYLGRYKVEGRDFTVRIVERGERLGVIVGSRKQEKIIQIGDHSFRCEDGRVQFIVSDTRASGLEFHRNDGRTVRAKRL